MNTALYLTMLMSIGLIALVRVKAHRIVRNVDDADEGCYYRKLFAKIRLIIVCIASIIYIIIISNLESLSGLTIGLISGWGAMCLSINFPAIGIRPSQISDKHFALYLRGFNRDNYSETIEDLQKTSKNDSFSEGRFVHLLKQYIPVYAVGMTKELEAPHGATRVYLNDSEWEQEVEVLMDKATIIVILLNESESCIWEIKHARKYKSKIVYICDNQDKLIKVRQKLRTIREGLIPICIAADTATYTDSKGESTTMPITHSDKDYSKFIHKLMMAKFGLKRRIFSNKENKKITSIIGIVLTPIVFVYSMLCENHPFFKELSHPILWFTVTIIILLLAIYYIREFMFRRRRNIYILRSL